MFIQIVRQKAWKFNTRILTNYYYYSDLNIRKHNFFQSISSSNFDGIEYLRKTSIFHLNYFSFCWNLLNINIKYKFNILITMIFYIILYNIMYYFGTLYFDSNIIV